MIEIELDGLALIGKLACGAESTKEITEVCSAPSWTSKQTLYRRQCLQQDTDSREGGPADWIQEQGMSSEVVKRLVHNHGRRI